MPSDSPHNGHPACFYDAWRIRKALTAYKAAKELSPNEPLPAGAYVEVPPDTFGKPTPWFQIILNCLAIIAWWLAIVGLWWAALT